MLLAGGVGSDGKELVETVEVFQANQGLFFTGASLRTPRVWHQAALSNNGVVIVGGQNKSQRVLLSSEAYLDGELQDMFSLRVKARRAFTLTRLPDGTLLASGGIDDQGQVLASTELLIPQGGPSWSIGPDMRVARAYHTATLLEDGTVLFIGGISSTGQATDLIERFDPAKERAEERIVPLKGALLLPRWAHTATQLADKRVLVVGGFGADKHGAAVAVVEAIQFVEGDAVNINVRQLGNMREARSGHSATRLKSNLLLIAGGFSGNSTLDTAEVFVY